jgi:hypothetical protein
MRAISEREKGPTISWRHKSQTSSESLKRLSQREVALWPRHRGVDCLKETSVENNSVKLNS